MLVSDLEVDRMEDGIANLKGDMKQGSVIHNPDLSIANFWHKVGSKEQYKTLSKLALLLCTTPHSNAIAERVFSMIGKNLTASRKSMSKDTTLENMVVKCANLDDGFTPSDALMKKAKQSTRLSLLK